MDISAHQQKIEIYSQLQSQADKSLDSHSTLQVGQGAAGEVVTTGPGEELQAEPSTITLRETKDSGHMIKVEITCSQTKPS